jgi:apolipoprotein N-acyltransferase
MNKNVGQIRLFLGTLLSGLAFFFAIDLSGSFGWLLWIAPLPILLIAFRSTGKQTFLCAFIACLIGRLNWVEYLNRVLPVALVVVFTLILPVLYALVILGVRKMVLARDHFTAIFAYPFLLTGYEYVALSVSYDGTAGSLAYTQCNYLSIIQIASVTGIWGIAFVAALVPSTLAVAWHLRSNVKQAQFALSGGSLLLLAVFAFGWFRLSDREHTSIPVGLTVIPESQHHFTRTPALVGEKEVIMSYLGQIKSLADQGARIILFPEKAIQSTDDQLDSILGLFRRASMDSKIGIVAGITVNKPESRQNLAEFIASDGTVQGYKKVFHVKGFEDGFERGENVGFLQGLPTAAGMAICKDLDYPAWLRNYGDVNLLFVPAWDFETDGWLHSRMAVMRGVENGFTLVRAARQGRLTVSDYRGKVLNEVSCENGQSASLLAQAPIYSIKTVYSSWGDWFGVASALIGVLWLILSLKKK